MVNFRLLCNKKRVSLIGAGALAGFILVSKMLPVTTTSCLASCSNLESPPYHRLQSNEFSISFDHPKISKVYVNTLGSNSPNEDRYVAGGWKQDCTGLFGVIDGHKTQDCSEHLKNTLLKHVTETFSEENLIDTIKVETYNKTMPLPLSYNDALGNGKATSVIRLRPDDSNEECTLREGVEEVLLKSFVSLDNKISEDALKCVRAINQGRSIKEEGMLPTIMRALAGACALLTVVSSQDIYVASTGDCRAVMGTKTHGTKAWVAAPLSIDQNAANSAEVSRVRQDHPNEDKTVIMANRLLGGLMPFRSFGDMDYKWAKEDIEGLTHVPPNYFTPPYLTAEPVVTRHVFEGGEKFLVLATDGLWDKLTNEQAVSIAAASLYGIQPDSGSGGLFGLFRRQTQDCCTDGNPATNLIWEALGGSVESVENMLNLPQQYKRLYRDDITVIVIQFK